MIPHSSAGVQPWAYPARAAVNSGTGRVDVAQAVGHFDPRPERLPTPQLQSIPPAVIELSEGGTEVQEGERPTKRPRLDAPVPLSMGDAAPASIAVWESKNTSGPANPRRPSVPVRARPVWSFQGLVSDTLGLGPHGADAIAAGQSDESALLPALPALPWKYPPPDSVEGSSGRSREGSPSKDVPTTPYRIQVPDAAPVLKDTKIGDFAPWTGNHPEDVLNEQTVKQGHYDRTLVSQNESNTARPSLYAQLKHRSGLQILSSVFATAFEKRQDHNAINTPSTFKPPPRVTLTDNKRETWLRDLANPSVPLRRLSRTIPHGIRGKILLEQCLGKWIPVGRAVWLAKCVGANEIRAFKRKGTNGALAVGLEAKWVRDWTTNVQQFVEGVLSTCGAADWKIKMRYAVGLTARLFFENLLDHDHYLEWLLSSLEAASISALPIWLLMLGIYWDNIMRYRKRGRRLAEVLLEKLREVTKSEQAGPFQQLNLRLSCFIKRLAREHTSSMVLPNSWDRYKELVLACLNLKDSVDKAIFQSLVERNLRVQRPQSWQRTTQLTPRQRVIRLLDSKKSVLDISSVSAACLNAVEDRATLVSSVLEWCATPFRHGLCRVYTCVRLLRKWKMCGIDVDSHILSFLTGTPERPALNMENVYHTIAELVRSQTFSVGKYLQWLMARGVVDSSQLGQHKGVSADIGLLAQLPTNRMPEHVYNLRNTLFARLGFSVSEETSTTAAAKASIGQRLPKIFDGRADGVIPRDLSSLDLTWAVKAEIGQWVRRGVAQHYLNSSRPITRIISADSGISALTPEEFYTVRDILEDFEDLAMLADVLKHAANCDDSTVLASAADTINYHLDSFYAIGATTDLFRRLFEAYTRLKRLGTADIDLLFSLIELAFQIPSEVNTLALLRQDFSRMETKSALAVSSPVSDHVPEISSAPDPSFHAKLDQILSPGSGIDEPTWDTTFNVLIKSLELGADQAKLPRNDTCRYLAQLRRFNPKRFDATLIRWVCDILKSSPRPPLLKILPPLIGVGCVSLQAFTTLVERLSQCDGGEHMIPNMDMLKAELVELLASRPGEQGSYFDLVSYRFYLAQQEFLAQQPEAALNIIRDAAALTNRQEQEPSFKETQIGLSDSMMKLLRTLLTLNPNDSAKHCMRNLTCQQPAFVAALQSALDRLLDFNSRSGQNWGVIEAEKVITMIDDFSLPFCELKLQMLFNCESNDEIKSDIVNAVFNAAVADPGAKRSHWVDLVALLSQDAVRQIRERAEKEFLSIPLLDSMEEDPSSAAAGSSRSIETAKSYLSIIEQLASGIPDAGVQSIAPVLVEKLDLLLQIVISLQTNVNHFTEDKHGFRGQTAQRANFERGVAFWFSALLRMVVIHRPAFSMAPGLPKPSSLAEQSRLLISIFCLSLSLFPKHILRIYPTADYFARPIQFADCPPSPGILMQTHALDVAASLIDTFPDETRNRCARFLKGKCPPFVKFQNDPRFAYLLGPMADAPSSVSLQPASLPSPAAAGSTPAPTPTPSGNLPTGSQQPSVPAEGSSSTPIDLRLQCRGRIIGAYPLRPWELLEGAAAIVGVNDTAVSLHYFDARSVKA